MFLGKAIVKFLLLLLNVLAVVVLLLTVAASHISPEKFLLPAFLSLFWPATVLVNVFFVVFWALFRKWFLLVSLLSMLFVIEDIRSLIPLNFGKRNIDSTELRVKLLTYNTHANDLMKKHKTSNPNEVIQYVIDQNADIVCIQEFSSSNYKEHLTHDDLMRIFKGYKYKHIEYKIDKGRSKFGVATFSKYPIVAKKRIELESDQNSAIYSDIDVNGNVIRLFNCHLESNKITEKDKVLARELTTDIRENLDASDLKITTALFKNRLGPAYVLRARQADLVSSEIGNSPYKVIVAGDFNDVPVSYAYRKVKGELVDAHDEFSMGPGWTYDQSIFRIRIDFILHDEALKFISFKKDKVKYSDHYPQLCEFVVN